MQGLEEWLAKELYEKSMLLLGRFKLSSGGHSTYYFDLRRMYSYPDIYRRIIEAFGDLVCLNGCPDMLIGVATAGIPLAAMTAWLKGLPMGYVRIERKSHGGGRLVEGVVKGRSIIVVDDVATTGRSIAEAVEKVRKSGGMVRGAAVIIDREEGAKELLGKMGVKLYSLAKAPNILRILGVNPGSLEEGGKN